MFSGAEKEREDAYRLRYQVYCEEMNLDSPNADHKQKTLTDKLDAFGHIFNIYSDEKCIATVRLNVLSEGDIGEFRNLYHVNNDSSADQTAILTKLMVLKEKRRTKILYALFKKAYVFGLKRSLSATKAHDVVPTDRAPHEAVGAAGEITVGVP